jgi:hypothetical protein
MDDFLRVSWRLCGGGIIGPSTELVCGQDKAGALHPNMADCGEPRVASIGCGGTVDLRKIGNDSSFALERP